MKVYFSDCFDVDDEVLADAGAFNVSLINDLPLFVDPFLLFTNPKYEGLHSQILRYLRFLREQSVSSDIDEGLLRSWYMFPEIKQLWLGFSLKGNRGSGLGIDFAHALHRNLNVIFRDFGAETITRGSHIEKVCLIRDGVGRDKISDFTVHLIKDYLLDFTQTFARKFIKRPLRKEVAVSKAHFDYDARVAPGSIRASVRRWRLRYPDASRHVDEG
jgi:hypothetical protein